MWLSDFSGRYQAFSPGHRPVPGPSDGCFPYARQHAVTHVWLASEEGQSSPSFPSERDHARARECMAEVALSEHVDFAAAWTNWPAQWPAPAAAGPGAR